MRVCLIIFLFKAVTASIQFNIASGPCAQGSGVFNVCDDSDAGALCASTSELDNSWCCRPEQVKCGSWGQTCTGAGNLAGKDQILCQSTGVDTSQKWCCKAQYETCVEDENRFNLCRTTFDNPYKNTSIEDALAIKAEFFATVSNAASSQTSTTSLPPTKSPTESPTRSSTRDTAQAKETNSSTSTSSQTVETTPPVAANVPTNPSDVGNPTQKSTTSKSLSSGAIAGIAIAGVAVIALIAVGAYLLGRRHIRKHESNKTQLASSGEVVSLANGSFIQPTYGEFPDTSAQLLGTDNVNDYKSGQQHMRYEVSATSRQLNELP